MVEYLLDDFVILVDLHVIELVAGPDLTLERGAHPHGNPDLFIFVSTFETSHPAASLTLSLIDCPFLEALNYISIF